MKITMNVECTPDEARAFLGLPDVKPMQEQLMQEVQERMMPLYDKVPREYENHGWVWLFLRKPPETAGAGQ